jgi:endonuclease/exonuclease/phosphatase (EEP) superfamily protein YafD
MRQGVPVRVVGWVLVGVLVLLAILSLDPVVVGLSTTTPVLQAIALRGVLAVAALGIGLVLLVVALMARRTRERGRRTLVLGVVLLLVGVGHGGVLAERGVDRAEALPAVAPGGAIDVLTLNTLDAAAGVDAVAAVVADHRPDVVALPETVEIDAQRIAEQSGLDFQVFADTTGAGGVEATALLVAAGLGEYEQTEAPSTTFAAVWASPVSGDGPDLLAVHVVPPLPADVATWRDELGRLTGLCRRVDGLIMAGDYNATLDHAPLRGAACGSAASTATGSDAGGVGTWPAGSPALLGSAIDHVMVDPVRWEATDAVVLDVPDGGDHRGVLVRLVPAG